MRFYKSAIIFKIKIILFKNTIKRKTKNLIDRFALFTSPAFAHDPELEFGISKIRFSFFYFIP
ncbi:hypothetical protein B8T70_10985 [Flavobacterium sp. AJR]|nr:hypothetical protein B8T70_10985 [Flavobacterium sp. AJR]